MCVSVCLPDPVSSSLVQSVMSMASSHSQHSHISTDTMSSMSGSYLAGGEGEPGAEQRGDVEAEDQNRDAFMDSRGPSQQDGVRDPASEGCSFRVPPPSFPSVSPRSSPRSLRDTASPWLWRSATPR